MNVASFRCFEKKRKDSDIKMVSKKTQEIKREKKRLKREKIEKTTNQYMINLAWGILVIILLRFVETGYTSMDTVLQMPVTMKVFAGIFAAASIGLFICGAKNVLNKKEVFVGYGIFTAVLALGSLWIGFYSNIRNFLGAVSPGILNIDSRWWVSRGPIVLVVVYLVVTLIWTTIKVALIEKGKKI